MKKITVLILALGFFYISSGNIYSETFSAVTGISGVVKYNEAKAFDGYNFYQNNNGYAYLMDMAGRLVWRWQFSTLKEGWGLARLLDNGDIVKICKDRYLAKFDKNSKLIWEIPIAANHDIAMLPDGTFLVPAFEPPVEYNNRGVIFDSIVHISQDGRILDTWSTYQHLKELQKLHPPLLLDKKQTENIVNDIDLDEFYHLHYFPWRSIHLYQYYHLNSIQVLPDTPLGLRNKNFQKGNWLICLRDANLIAILDKDTHQVVWSWGPGELDMPHMPRMLANGNILIFDNGMHRTYTRIVIVNPVSHNIVWEYKASPPQNFHSIIEGSAQLLPNGNFLICEAENGRAFEITPTGEIVWEFLNPEGNKDGQRMSIYRMLRIPKEEVSRWLGEEKAHSYPFGQVLVRGRWMPFIARQQEKGHTQPPWPKDVVIYDKNKSFPEYNLFISGNMPPVATLMDMNGKIIHQWHPPSPKGLWTKARILKNGDLLVLAHLNGILKIDKKSNLLWFKKLTCHDDFDVDSNGNIYTLTKLGNTATSKIDSITMLSPNGEIRKEIPLSDLFKKNLNPDYVNLNIADPFQADSIQFLDGKWTSKIPAFKKGNLLISMNNLGLVICVDPDKERIVWLMDKLFWEKGQHFAKLLDNGNILLFDNLYRADLSRVVEFDPASQKIVWDYSGENGRFFSYAFGECYRLPNGNTLITESLSGHSFEVTPYKKIVWEFYNPNQADKGSRQFNTINSKEHLHGRYNKLIAVIHQMQRIPIDPTLDWLKN